MTKAQTKDTRHIGLTTPKLATTEDYLPRVAKTGTWDNAAPDLPDVATNPRAPSCQSDEPLPPTILQLIMSVMAAFCGIQNYANHTRDEAHIERVGFMPYIIIGVVLTAAFVLLIYSVVNFVLLKPS
jgi:amino acid transporter